MFSYILNEIMSLSYSILFSFYKPWIEFPYMNKVFAFLANSTIGYINYIMYIEHLSLKLRLSNITPEALVFFMYTIHFGFKT